jgi:hypothetical protein
MTLGRIQVMRHYMQWWWRTMDLNRMLEGMRMLGWRAVSRMRIWADHVGGRRRLWRYKQIGFLRARASKERK